MTGRLGWWSPTSTTSVSSRMNLTRYSDSTVSSYLTAAVYPSVYCLPLTLHVGWNAVEGSVTGHQEIFNEQGPVLRCVGHFAVNHGQGVLIGRGDEGKLRSPVAEVRSVEVALIAVVFFTLRPRPEHTRRREHGEIAPPLQHREETGPVGGEKRLMLFQGTHPLTGQEGGVRVPGVTAQNRRPQEIGVQAVSRAAELFLGLTVEGTENLPLLSFREDGVTVGLDDEEQYVGSSHMTLLEETGEPPSRVRRGWCTPADVRQTPR